MTLGVRHRALTFAVGWRTIEDVSDSQRPPLVVMNSTYFEYVCDILFNEIANKYPYVAVTQFKMSNLPVVTTKASCYKATACTHLRKVWAPKRYSLFGKEQKRYEKKKSKIF